MAKNPTVTVVANLVVDQGNLRSLADVQLGPLVIRKVRLIQQPGQAPWVSPPQDSWTDAQGQRRFTTLVKWPPEWGQAILDAVLLSLEEHPEGFSPQDTQATFGEEVRRKAGIGRAS